MNTDQERLLLIHAYGDENSEALSTALRVARNSTERLGPHVAIQIVVQGPAVKLLTAGTIYEDDLATVKNHPAIRILACENSMASAAVERGQLLPAIGTVPSAVAHLAERQWDGAAYVRF